jgi:hypothetical protein
MFIGITARPSVGTGSTGEQVMATLPPPGGEGASSKKMLVVCITMVQVGRIEMALLIMVLYNVAVG